MSEQLDRFVAEVPHIREEIVRVVNTFALELDSGARVLDAGAGDAPYRELFKACDYVTHDWPSSPHAGAQHADIVSDIAQLPLADGSVDAVLCTEVLEHVRDPRAAARELARVLAPGGRILVTVPFVGELHEEPYDFQRFTSYGIAAVLEDAGFADIAVEPLGGWGTTAAQVLRNAGLATGNATGPMSGGRLCAWLLLVTSVFVGKLRHRIDRLDRRRALPVGWVATAHVA